MNKFTLISTYFGELYHDTKDKTIIYGFENESQQRHDEIEVPNKGGCFGYVFSGAIEIKTEGELVVVPKGFWFSTKSGFTALKMTEDFRFCVWQKEDYVGALTLGKVEDEGRLKYIDGAFDSILHSPIKFGMPCLNALFMPKQVHQTMHTHPSLRSGFIIKGGATCVTPEGHHLLETGQIFILVADAEHKFRSDLAENTEMKLVAYHPDSDFGPTDELHPMINRTIVNGVSAKNIDSIKTK